ncbi:MAG: hypothetical protein Q9191_002429 [Dirinaria sp. TL-2023a]
MPSALNNSALPSSDSPSLALVHPTQQEKIATWKLNGASWAGQLSLEAYLSRENLLENQPLTLDGGITFWILVDSNQTSTPRTILASCESLRKRALVRRGDGEVEETIAHGICSVFCNVDFRGQGYAGRMMKELGKALDTWQQQAGTVADFTVLFSDIGKRFYSKRGWEPFPSSHVALRALEYEERDSDSKRLPRADPLYDNDLVDLCRADETALRAKIAGSAKAQAMTVALLPDMETMQWHKAREVFTAKELLGKTPEVRGAIAHAENDSRVWCIWTRTFGSRVSENTLNILRMVIEGEEDLETPKPGADGASIHLDGANQAQVLATAAVLRAAQREAAKWTMNEVQVWNPSLLCQQAAKYLQPSSKLIDRENDSIASLRWHGPHLVPGVTLSWLGIEKYGWC